MAKYWNLKTNKFVEIGTQAAEEKGYEPVKTLQGDVVYIPCAHDGYGINVAKAFEVINEVGARVNEIIDDGDEWKRENVEKFYSGLDSEQCFYFWLNKNIIVSYLKEIMIVDRKRKPLIARCMNNAIVDGVSETEGRFTEDAFSTYYCHLSRKFLKTIFAKCESTSLKEACDFYGISASKLEELANLEVTRVYLKAFNKEGVSFVLARILTSQGVTVAREGIGESVGPEDAELELLRRISEVAKKQGLPVEVVSGQLNIVNWLEGKNQPKTHEALRAEILAWLKPLGYSSRKMTDEEQEAYRKEKKSL